jgi:hypothetical protein
MTLVSLDFGWTDRGVRELGVVLHRGLEDREGLRARHVVPLPPPPR